MYSIFYHMATLCSQEWVTYIFWRKKESIDETRENLELQVKLKQYMQHTEAQEGLEAEQREQAVIQAAIAHEDHLAALKKAETQSELSHEL